MHYSSRTKGISEGTHMMMFWPNILLSVMLSIAVVLVANFFLHMFFFPMIFTGLFLTVGFFTFFRWLFSDLRQSRR